MKHDAIYARYSSHGQDDSTSIEVQVEHCQRTAGGKLVEYIDRAKTGRAVAHRTELLRLLDDAEAGKIGRVFVYKFDRLGRSADVHVVAQQLEDAGVELISATEGKDALTRGIHFVVAEDFSKRLGQRTRDGLIKRFEQGAFTGGAAPYGYRIIESNGAKRLAVDETEAAIVQEIFGSYLRESIGCKEIARRLRARNVPTRRGRGDGWQFTSVRSILRNPVYTGEVSFNRREMVLRRAKGRRVPKFKDAAEVLTRQDDSLRIIDAETWQAVKDKIKRRETIPSNPTPSGPRPFTGLLHCSCGNVYHRKTSANSKATYHYWQCGAITMYDRCKDKPKVREDELVNVVRSAAAEVFNDAEGLIAEAIAEAEAQIGDNRAEASRIRQDIEAATADAGRLAMQLVDITEPAARRAIARLLGEAETRRETLQASLGRLADKATFDAEKLAQSIRNAVERAREDFTSILTPAEAHATMERYIGKVTVEADGTLTPKETPPAVAEGVTSSIAGGRFATGILRLCLLRTMVSMMRR